MADVQTLAQAERPLFTCLSCSIAFLTAEEQSTVPPVPPFPQSAD
jgi:hypothetical protein